MFARFHAFFRIFIIAILGSAGALIAQGSSVVTTTPQPDPRGDYGQLCYDDETCDLGLYCNTRSNLCERCGDTGEPACPDEACVEGDGWEPRQFGADPISYCAYVRDDFQARQMCGFSGYKLCPGSELCRGLAVKLDESRFCVACGVLGQRCCADKDCPASMNAVCLAGRCRPAGTASSPQGQGTTGIQTTKNSGGGRPADDTATMDLLSDAPVPPILSDLAGTGLNACRCVSSDGRNKVCEDNGCTPPPGYGTMKCMWECEDNTGRAVSFYGETGGRVGEDPPPLPPDDGTVPPILSDLVGTGLHGCACFSSDGRNRTCLNNGCTPPPGYGSMSCYWACDDANGGRVEFDGATGALR